MTINASSRDFAREGFADALEAKMIKAKLSPSLLGIECLESERIIENLAAMRGLEMLKLRGGGVSLDDFGTGYSNISYLRRMPLDVIKLDRTLISEILSDTASRIIAMLKDLDYTVLAEGVKDADTVTELTEYGCDQAQGFFYFRPLPEAELDEWLSWSCAASADPLPQLPGTPRLPTPSWHRRTGTSWCSPPRGCAPPSGPHPPAPSAAAGE